MCVDGRRARAERESETECESSLLREARLRRDSRDASAVAERVPSIPGARALARPGPETGKV